MTVQPRIFIHNEIPMLVHVVWEDGKISNIQGPVATQGSEGMDCETFKTTVIDIMTTACNLAPLTIDDLPEELQKELTA